MEIKMIQIKIPFRTPTINHLYWHKGNMKIMKKEAREIREEIKKICDENVSSEDYNETLPNMGIMKVEVEIHENWFNKDGTVKRKDISNREKFLIDSIFNALDLEDKFIFEHKMKKVQSDKEFAIVKIGVLE